MVIAMTNDDLDDSVDEWHNSPDDGTSLCDYLGMTRDEYGAWVKDPSAIPDDRWLS